MLLLKIIIFALGITFSIFGYLIVFKKKFGLINDFEARKKVGSQTDADAIRVGKIALTLGCWITCTICVINDIYVEKYCRKRVWQ